MRVLYTSEEALTLRQGFFRSRMLRDTYTLQELDVLEAAEILIALNDARNFYSQADLIERAMSYGWIPESLSANKLKRWEDERSQIGLQGQGTSIANPFVRNIRKWIVYPCISRIKQFLFEILRMNVYTVDCSGISTDLLVKVHHIRKAGHRIRQVAISSDGGWVILYGKSRFSYSDISTLVSDKLWEFGNAGEVIQQIVFAPNDGWVVLRDYYGFWQYNVPRRMADKLWSCFNSKQSIDNVAIAANQGWIISTGKNQFAYDQIPPELSNKLWEFQAAGETIKQIAFAPNGGWVIVREYNDFWYDNLPDDLIEMLWNYRRSGKEIWQVCFAPNSGWIVLGR